MSDGYSFVHSMSNGYPIPSFSDPNLFKGVPVHAGQRSIHVAVTVNDNVAIGDDTERGRTKRGNDGRAESSDTALRPPPPPCPPRRPPRQRAAVHDSSLHDSKAATLAEAGDGVADSATGLGLRLDGLPGVVTAPHGSAQSPLVPTVYGNFDIVLSFESF